MTDLLSVPEAAKVAGVSERTMRRWATNGHVRTVGRGHARRIPASELAAMNGHGNGQVGHPGSDERPAQTATADESGHLADLVRELQDRVADLAGAAAMWQARAMMLEEHMKALEAPKPVSEFVPPAVHDPVPPSPNAAPRRWRRWWLAVMGAGLVLMVGASCQQPTRWTVSAPHLCRAAQFSLARVEQELAPQANPVLGGTLMGTWTGVNELVTVIERLCRP